MYVNVKMKNQETQTWITWIPDKKKYLNEHAPSERLHHDSFRKRTESKANKVKETLIDFLQRRQTKEEIVMMGIMKNRPVFGADLKSLVIREGVNDGVPIFVRRCIEAVEAPHRIEREGIYRINGNAAQIQRLRVTVDEMAEYDLNDPKYDVHTLTGLFKLFFREMQEPLIPQSLFADMRKEAKTREAIDENSISHIQKCVATMKGCNYQTLKALVTHLVKVLKADNRMSAENLALVFGPNVMWQHHKEPPAQSWNVENIIIPSKVVQTLLTHPEILEDKRKSR